MLFVFSYITACGHSKPGNHMLKMKSDKPEAGWTSKSPTDRELLWPATLGLLCKQEIKFIVLSLWNLVLSSWRIPWTEEPGGLQSTVSQRVRHDWSDLARTHNAEHCLTTIQSSTTRLPNKRNQEGCPARKGCGGCGQGLLRCQRMALPPLLESKGSSGLLWPTEFSGTQPCTSSKSNCEKPRELSLSAWAHWPRCKEIQASLLEPGATWEALQHEMPWWNKPYGVQT